MKCQGWQGGKLKHHGGETEVPLSETGETWRPGYQCDKEGNLIDCHGAK